MQNPKMESDGNSAEGLWKLMWGVQEIRKMLRSGREDQNHATFRAKHLRTYKHQRIKTNTEWNIKWETEKYGDYIGVCRGLISGTGDWGIVYYTCTFEVSTHTELVGTSGDRILQGHAGSMLCKSHSPA